MSSANSTLFYHVYLPEGRNYFRVAVTSDPLLAVSDLADAIEKHNRLRKALQPNDSFKLYKYCKKYKSPPNEFYSGVVKWLHANLWGGEYMEDGSLLSKHFPCGPAPIADEQIDVIIVTDSFSKSLRPVTPENQARPDVDFTPRKRAEETQKLVSDFLSERDRSLREYISGPEWKVFWEAPSSIDEQTRDFINYLKIPRVKATGDPVLLLHDLGKDIVDPSVMDNLFTLESRLLVNTSGSGKTRLLFEGLTRHWGFYFTPAATTPENHFLGSTDLQTIINRDIPESKHFVEDPETLPAEKQGKAYLLNGSIAERRFSQMLTARCLIFEWFLKTIQETFPDRPASEFRRHWLFLQLRSVDILVDGDVFRQLSDLLKDASDEYLLRGPGDVHDRVRKLQTKFGLDEKFYLILDEAQVTLNKMQTCFCSDQNQAVKRPILKPLIRSWQDLASSLTMIVSGTGLSIDLVNEVMISAVVKVHHFKLATTTGSFDDQNRQRAYILRYVPKYIAESDSGKVLIDRAWNYLRGRHRFTAELIGQLLKLSFRSPHTILNSYVERFSGFRPTDCRDLVSKEPGFGGEVLMQSAYQIVKLDLSKIMSNDEMKREISNALFHWILLGRKKELVGLKKELVELGFARFGGIDKAYVDEPLVLLLAANEFSETAFSFNTYVSSPISEFDNKGEMFERYVAFYLACAFDGKSKLCDIFDFGTNPPAFSREPAELVSIFSTDHGLEANRFNLLIGEVATHMIGFQAKTFEGTVEWLRNPSNVMCFPDKSMGPDIVAFIRVAGEILCVILQCKWRSQTNLDPGTVQSAESSLNIDKSFNKKNLGAAKTEEGRECFFDLLKRVRREGFNAEDPHMEWDDWLQKGLPVLSVIAAYPAETPDASEYPYYAVLNMDRVESIIDKDKILRRVAAAWLKVPKRSAEEHMEASRRTSPRKKPRT